MKKKVAIIGGGTAGLFLAAFLDNELFDVTIYEKKASLGRKFLVAGDGGFNLSHSEEFSSFKSKYTPALFLDEALDHFNNSDLRDWLQSIGIPTFVGSSGKIFPKKGIKPFEVLKAIEEYLRAKGIQFEFNKTFTGWDKEGLIEFNAKETLNADYSIFALGGASWKVTGSDGSWHELFSQKGIDTLPFRSSNCAYKINWNASFIQKNEGTPLKNISISIKNKVQAGEAVITKFGIEGNAIYGLSPEIQNALDSKKEAVVYVDFKPSFNSDTLLEKITNSQANITSTLKSKLKLPTVLIDLLKNTLTKDEFLDLPTLVKYIKEFPLTIIAAAPIDEAISTSGGIDLKAINPNFELKQMKDHFCIGEMLTWDAPTGGYLIQACASMGAYLANQLNNQK